MAHIFVSYSKQDIDRLLRANQWVANLPIGYETRLHYAIVVRRDAVGPSSSGSQPLNDARRTRARACLVELINKIMAEATGSSVDRVINNMSDAQLCNLVRAAADATGI